MASVALFRLHWVTDECPLCGKTSFTERKLDSAVWSVLTAVCFDLFKDLFDVNTQSGASASLY